MLSVTMFPAKNGDCFLISFGEDEKKHILIDCGYAETYRKYLRKELISIAERGECISLFVITHADQDHILGAIPFLKENNERNIIGISEIWYNSYRHLQFPKVKESSIGALEKKILEEEIALGGAIIEKCDGGAMDSEISFIQGSTLASLIFEGNYSWNKTFDGKAVSTSLKQFVEVNGMNLCVLSPDDDKLNALSKDWLMHLQSQKYNFTLADDQIFDDAFEFYMLGKPKLNIVDESVSKGTINDLNQFSKMKQNEIDTAVANGSSIAFYAEYAGKKLIFLADSHPDIVFSNITELGKLGFLKGGLDLVKISHHGSERNITSELAHFIPSQKYLISTNGKTHGHPDLAAMARIITANNKGKRELIFNYPTDTATALNNKEWMEKYNYTVTIADGENPIVLEL